jgi:hypothetical protein
MSSANKEGSGLRVIPIVRDIAIVWVLTGIGGFVVGFATAIATGGASKDSQHYLLAIAVSNLLLGTIGFTIAACLTPADRWRQLGIVAVGVWLTSLVNVFFAGFSIVQWIFGAISIAVMMGVGGSISFLFVTKKA